MKKSDIVTTTFVAVLGLILSVFITSLILGDPNQKNITFQDVEVVQKDVANPSPDTFNSQALDPTVEVFVGDGSQNKNAEK